MNTLLDEIQDESTVLQGYEVTDDRLIISKGLDLHSSTRFLNLEIVSPDDPDDKILFAFTREAVRKLLLEAEECADEIWDDYDE